MDTRDSDLGDDSMVRKLFVNKKRGGVGKSVKLFGVESLQEKFIENQINSLIFNQNNFENIVTRCCRPLVVCYHKLT